MKTTLIFIFIIITSSCKGQIDEKQLIGLWEYENTTNLNNLIVESSVEEFKFNIKLNNRFIMKGKEYTISGKWRIENDTLILDGTRTDINETRTEKMPINKISDTMFSFKIRSESDKPLIVNLKKIE